MIRLLKQSSAASEVAATSRTEADKTILRISTGFGKRATAAQRQQMLAAVEGVGFLADDVARIIQSMSEYDACSDDGKQCWGINNILTKEVTENMRKDTGGAHIILIRHLVKL